MVNYVTELKIKCISRGWGGGRNIEVNNEGINFLNLILHVLQIFFCELYIWEAEKIYIHSTPTQTPRRFATPSTPPTKIIPAFIYFNST